MVEDGNIQELVDKSLELSCDSINFLNIKKKGGGEKKRNNILP